MKHSTIPWGRDSSFDLEGNRQDEEFWGLQQTNTVTNQIC